MIERIKRLWAPPDRIMLELGAGGELVVARIRLALAALLFLPPIINTLSGGHAHENLIGFLGAAFAVSSGVAWWYLARQRGRFAWLPWASTTYDITSVTLFLFLLAHGDRAAGTNSFIIWEFYLTSLLMTCLRNDTRLTLYAGALAIAQFLWLGHWVLSTDTPAQLVSVDYGTANVTTIAQRAVVLFITTLIAVTTVARMNRLAKLSGTDSLTGIPNRSWFLHQANLQIAQSKLHGFPLSTAILDLDHFKRINDQIGHLAGDDALVHAVGIINAHLSPRDWVGRLGGEEFGLLMRADADEALRRTDAIRSALADSSFTTPESNDPIRITLSSGIASCPGDGQTLNNLMGIADRRLRNAKSAGRNCVHHRD